MKADLEKILWLYENYSVYSIAKATGIPSNTLNPYKLGKRKFANMTLEVASRLTKYAETLIDKKTD